MGDRSEIERFCKPGQHYLFGSTFAQYHKAGEVKLGTGSFRFPYIFRCLFFAFRQSD